MSSLAIHLPEDLDQFVRSTVKSGAYRDTDEFFVSVLTTLKEQAESPLTDEECATLAALRTDIQVAVKQAEQGEIVKGWKVNDFLTRR
jgi:putative addiction module CopG family antidote